MSMTSKVDPGLRAEILRILSKGISAGNNMLRYYVEGGRRSLRSIQEATQKLTREGVLVQKKRGRYTYFESAPTVTQGTINTL